MNRYAERLIFEKYIADSLYAISRRGKLESRLSDLLPAFLQPIKKQKEESADSIISRMKRGLARMGGKK